MRFSVQTKKHSKDLLTSAVPLLSLYVSVPLTTHIADAECMREISNSRLSRRQEQPSDNNWPSLEALEASWTAA